jgi:hypothetical protein
MRHNFTGSPGSTQVAQFMCEYDSEGQMFGWGTIGSNPPNTAGTYFTNQQVETNTTEVPYPLGRPMAIRRLITSFDATFDTIQRVKGCTGASQPLTCSVPAADLFDGLTYYYPMRDFDNILNVAADGLVGFSLTKDETESTAGPRVYGELITGPVSTPTPTVTPTVTPTEDTGVLCGISPEHWYDFSDPGTLTFNGINISAIADKGTDGADLTAADPNDGCLATISNETGVPVAQCDGDESYAGTPSGLSQPYYVWIVDKAASAVSSSNILTNTCTITNRRDGSPTIRSSCGITRDLVGHATGIDAHVGWYMNRATLDGTGSNGFSCAAPGNCNTGTPGGTGSNGWGTSLTFGPQIGGFATFIVAPTSIGTTARDCIDTYLIDRFLVDDSTPTPTNTTSGTTPTPTPTNRPGCCDCGESDPCIEPAPGEDCGVCGFVSDAVCVEVP